MAKIRNHEAGNKEIGQVPTITSKHLSSITLQTGTYDTVKIIKNDVPHECIIDPERFTTRTTLNNLKGGDLGTLDYIAYLDANGDECEKGDHITTLGIKYDTNSGTAIINAPSAPSLTYGDPLRPLIPDDVPRFQNTLQSIASRYIDYDFSDAHAIRVDPSTVYEMPRPVARYIDMLTAISLNKQKRMHKKPFQNQTIQFGNKSQSFGLYDKSAKEFYKKGINDGRNLLRVEHQMKNTRTIRRYLGDLTLSNLSNEQTIRKAIETRANRFYDLFPFNSKKIKTYEMHFEILESHRKNGKRNAIENMALAACLREGLLTPSDISAMMEVVGYSRQSVWNAEQKMNDLLATSREVSDIYGEIKECIDNDLKAIQ